MDRRTFVKGATLGVASTALPFTAHLARSAPAGPVVHHQRAIAFQPFDELAEHYAPALRNLTPEQAVRRLYRGMLGISKPLPKGVDVCVQYWERQGAEGPALTLRWFMQHPAFRFARPRDAQGYVASGVSKELAEALTRWKQTDILYRALWNRPPSPQESTDTLLSLATIVPMGRGGTTTILLPRQLSSWITWSPAHAEIDYAVQETVMTPAGPVPVALANQLNAAAAQHGFNHAMSFATLTAIAAMAGQLGIDVAFAIGQAAAGLAEGTIDTTVNAVQGLISLYGQGMLVLSTLLLTIKVTQTQITATLGGPTGPSTSVGTPPGGPSSTAPPEGTVTVGEISIVDVGPTTDEGSAAAPDGNSGAGGSDGSDGAPE